jgi:hypothetical protein
MTVIRGADIKIEIQAPTSAWSDVTCEVTSADWTWGAVTPLGPLTETEGGWMRISLYDPTRKYDPTNPSSPLFGALVAGMPMRVTVDGSPAWTGALDSWGRDPDSGISDLRGVDPIGELAVKNLMRPAQTIFGTTDVQVNQLLDQIKWPAARRYMPTSGGIVRGATALKQTVLDGLQQIRYAELGALFARRDGKVGWWNRAGPTPPAVSAIINCNGVDLTALAYVVNPNRTRNRVTFGFNYGIHGDPSIPENEVRHVTPDLLDLQMAVNVDPFPWDLWASKVLAELADPKPLSVLGTMLPVGAEIRPIVCAEYGDRWEVRVTGETARVVIVLGMTVTLTPGWLEVEAITENVAVPPISVIAVVRTEASDGTLTSESTIYSDARAGTGPSPPVADTTASLFPVGQEFISGSLYRCHENFLRFNTGVLPDTAIIDAAYLTVFVQTISTVSFTLEARTKAWGPTVTSADWVAGASLGGLTLLGSLTGLTLYPGETYGGWYTFTSTAAFKTAVNRTGYTEIMISSSRLRTGTAPTAADELVEVQAFEAGTGLPAYLQVVYHMP